MFPIIEVEENLITQEKDESIGKTYLFDFDEGEFILKDGKLVIANELQAIEMWIRKVISTEKFKFKIYEKPEEEKDEEYGITIKNLIGKKLPREMIQSEIKREITKVLLEHPNIEKLSDFEVSQDGLKVIIKFKVSLVDGTVITQEVIR